MLPRRRFKKKSAVAVILVTCIGNSIVLPDLSTDRAPTGSFADSVMAKVDVIKSLWEFNPSGITEARRKRSLVAFLTHTPAGRLNNGLSRLPVFGNLLLVLPSRNYLTNRTLHELHEKIKGQVVELETACFHFSMPSPWAFI